MLGISHFDTSPYYGYGLSEIDLGLMSKGRRDHGLDNVWLVSTAVLPSAGTVNPTFTVLWLAEQAID